MRRGCSDRLHRHFCRLALAGLSLAFCISTSQASQINLTIDIDLTTTGQVLSITDNGLPTGNPGAVWQADIPISPIVLNQADVVRLALRFTDGQQLRLADNGGGFLLGGNEHLAIAFLRQSAGVSVVGSSEMSVAFVGLIGDVTSSIVGVSDFSGDGAVNIRSMDLFPAGQEIAFGGIDVEFTLTALSQSTSPLDVLQVTFGAEIVERRSGDAVSEPGAIALLAFGLALMMAYANDFGSRRFGRWENCARRARRRDN